MFKFSQPASRAPTAHRDPRRRHSHLTPRPRLAAQYEPPVSAHPLPRVRSARPAPQCVHCASALTSVVPDDLKKTATPIGRDLTVGQVSVRSESKWISEVAEHDGVAAVEYFLHYHELNGKAERKRILKYFHSDPLLGHMASV